MSTRSSWLAMILLFAGEFVQQRTKLQNLFPLQAGIIADVETIKMHVIDYWILLEFLISHNFLEIRLPKLVTAAGSPTTKFHAMLSQRSHDVLAQDRIW